MAGTGWIFSTLNWKIFLWFFNVYLGKYEWFDAQTYTQRISRWNFFFVYLYDNDCATYQQTWSLAQGMLLVSLTCLPNTRCLSGATLVSPKKTMRRWQFAVFCYFKVLYVIFSVCNDTQLIKLTNTHSFILYNVMSSCQYYFCSLKFIFTNKYSYSLPCIPDTYRIRHLVYWLQP